MPVQILFTNAVKWTQTIELQLEYARSVPPEPCQYQSATVVIPAASKAFLARTKELKSAPFALGTTTNILQ